MKNNYSIAQRNAIVEANLWCIDNVIRQNRPLMRAARLEYDDVYQQLALRLIKAVAGYDPEKGRLEQHIFAQLKYELLTDAGKAGAGRENRRGQARGTAGAASWGSTGRSGSECRCGKSRQ